ncbi:hypothetical protein F0344_01385 [Streptomyces finlayi]|uniref:Uncharacterized protein n=1 Tax=Streptomyces finlayi TaxID=67296 RepID=A0A7G7BDN1_9ACTN|nr:hypothetical protein [Streptomyces finlayi]QNE73446.1 hypothetical protein F0344_01385 [Streptomyces finlayi]
MAPSFGLRRPARAGRGDRRAGRHLPAPARGPVAQLTHALAQNDAALLVAPLGDTQSHLNEEHPELAARVADITHRAVSLCRHSDTRRRNGE